MISIGPWDYELFGEDIASDTRQRCQFCCVKLLSRMLEIGYVRTMREREREREGKEGWENGYLMNEKWQLRSAQICSVKCAC